jgi:hypothetical protein
LLERSASDTDIVFVKDGLVKRFGRVDGDEFGFLDVSPYEFWISAQIRIHGEMRRTIGSSTLFEIKDHDFPINDFHVLGNMNSSKGIITSDHNTLPISSSISRSSHNEKT